MWSHPGKQLIFMGIEFGQESEWADGRSLDWWLLDLPLHYRVHALVKDLNAIYRSNRALWELDSDGAGFEWLNADDAAGNTFSWLRWGRGDRASAPVVACLVNFSGQTHESYRIGLPRGGRWRVIMDTAGYHPDAPSSTGRVIEPVPTPWQNQPYAADLTIPRLSAVWVVPIDEPAAPAQAPEVAAEATQARGGTDAVTLPGAAAGQPTVPGQVSPAQPPSRHQAEPAGTGGASGGPHTTQAPAGSGQAEEEQQS
jgi:1,4-alpha-glucan branching enzyme